MHQGERSIQIVGENALQNFLLSAYLEESVGARCICRAKLECVPSRNVPDADENLILIDCFGMQWEEIASLVESEAVAKVTARTALFNLRSGTSIEQTAIRCGIRGFFYLEDAPASLIKGVIALFDDEYWVSRKMLVDFLFSPIPASNVAARYPGLTLRESELIGLLIRGLSNQSIADLLFISIPTVKTHLSSVYRKINVNNRLQAVCWAEKTAPTRPRSQV